MQDDFLKFPDSFRWGSATSAHQIEGNNRNDWSEWEQSPARLEQLKAEKKDPAVFISGQACDSYNRYAEDFDIAQKLNHNTHRFSIEWSRIEPEEGKFDHDAMRHYIAVVDALRERGIEPMVTLWHFTNPIWFARKGGFLNHHAPELYKRYVSYVVDNLKDRVGLWITFNEATTSIASYAYFRGIFPPQEKNLYHMWLFRKNIIKAHILAYREIKNLYRSWPQASLGTTIDDTSHNIGPRVGTAELNFYPVLSDIGRYVGLGIFFNNFVNSYLWSQTIPFQDFLGLNYYTNYRFHWLPGTYRALPKQDAVLEMGWEIHPEGIYLQLMYLKKFKKPIYITENGIADAADARREKFIRDHLFWIWKAIQDGVDVRGYLYWSLLDNFEWAKGFTPRFGLVEVDYQTFERSIRPSALAYAKIIQENGYCCPHS